ncbi:MAG: GNAT family N-acetyltransferase [Lachnospiraceae bacterium]|jgi:RimJ/RimL family protein N-acetyltransferase
MGELSIRTADWKDLPEINLIYQYARKFMAEMGNPSQWGNKFPLESQIRKDIENRQFYVVETSKGICGVFALTIGPDSTYAKIEDGQWLSESEYGTIHRVAGNGTARGVFEAVIRFCEQRIQHLRIDTHKDNKIMQHLIEKHGFSRRGIIYAANGSARIGFEKLGTDFGIQQETDPGKRFVERHPAIETTS